MSEWIDIKKEKPKAHSCFLGYVPAKTGEGICLCFEAYGKYGIAYTPDSVEVTHWMPLPEPPQIEEIK